MGASNFAGGPNFLGIDRNRVWRGDGDTIARNPQLAVVQSMAHTARCNVGGDVFSDDGLLGRMWGSVAGDRGIIRTAFSGGDVGGVPLIPGRRNMVGDPWNSSPEWSIPAGSVRILTRTT